jgi:Cu+-exporting ATPase
LGIRLEGLSLHDLHPPQDVVAFYHDVAKAMQARDRQVNDAQAEALRVTIDEKGNARTRRAALVRALQIQREAKASAHETVTQAESAQAAFLARQSIRSQLSTADEWRLVKEAIRAVCSGQEPLAAYQDYERSRQARLMLQAALTDFRLYWDALAGALVDREKVIIDADKVPGRRHLLFIDPEQFRFPVPFVLPREGSPTPPRSPRAEMPSDGETR